MSSLSRAGLVALLLNNSTSGKRDKKMKTRTLIAFRLNRHLSWLPQNWRYSHQYKKQKPNAFGPIASTLLYKVLSIVYFLAFISVCSSSLMYVNEHCKGIVNPHTSIQADILFYALCVLGVLASSMVYIVGLHWYLKEARSVFGFWGESNRFLSSVMVLLRVVLNSDEVTEKDIYHLATTTGEYQEAHGYPTFNPVERFSRIVRDRLAVLAFTVKECELILRMSPSWLKQKMVENRILVEDCTFAKFDFIGAEWPTSTRAIEQYPVAASKKDALEAEMILTRSRLTELFEVAENFCLLINLSLNQLYKGAGHAVGVKYGIDMERLGLL